MPQKPSEQEILRTVRAITGDRLCTAPTLAKLFTLAQVDDELEAVSGTVRRSFGSRLRLAEAVRLADMEQTLAELGKVARGRAGPPKRFESWCSRLMQEDGCKLFQESGRIAHIFRNRLQDDLMRIARHGLSLGVFRISDLHGAALLAIDALSAIFLSEHSLPRDVEDISYERDDGEYASLLESHVGLLLRAWGWENDGRRQDAPARPT